MSLYSRLDRIAADVARLDRQLTSVSNHPQSQRTSVEGGSIDFNDDDGNLMAIVGSQDDGGNTINVISGPTPPTPVGFTVDVDHGKFIVHWSGDFEGDALAPSDWSRAEVHASQDPFFVPSRATARGSIVSAAGGEVTIGVLKGPWTIKMLAWSQAGKMSAPSAPVDVEVPGYGDIVLEEIDAANTEIKNGNSILVNAQDTLGGKLDSAFGQLDGLNDDLSDLGDAVAGAVASANGKNTVHFDDHAPGPDDEGVAGDTWFVGEVGRPNDVVEATNLWRGSKLSEDRSALTSNVWQNNGGEQVEDGLELTIASTPGTSAQSLAYTAGAYRVPIEGGSTYSVSVPVRNSGGSDFPLKIAVYVGKASGGDSRSKSTLTVVKPGETQIVRVEGIETAETDADLRFSVRYDSGEPRPVVGGKLVLLDGITFVQDDVAADPFNGDTPSGVTDNEPHYRWTGEPYASASEKYLPATDGLSDKWNVTEQYRHDGTNWVQVELSHNVISSVDIGALTAGSAAIKEAVVEQLFAQVVVSKMAVADEFIGENAILTGAVTAPKITASEELWAKLAQFVRVNAEMVDSDAFNGRVFTGNTYLTSDGNGEFADRGLFFRRPDGTSILRVPTDGSPMSLSASDVQIDRATVQELEFIDGNIQSGGQLVLRSGVTPPASPPDLSAGWPRVTKLPKPDPGHQFDWTGLAYWNSGPGYWVRTVNVLGAAGEDLDAIELYNSTTGALVRSIPIDNNPRHGVAVIGNVAYVMGPDRVERPGEQKNWVHGFNLDTGVRVTRWEFVRNVNHRFGVGTDGSNLVFAAVGANNRTLYVTKWNPATGAQSGVDLITDDWVKYTQDVEAVHIVGNSLFVSHTEATRRFTISGSTLTYDASRAWENPNKNASGMTWRDGAPFVVDGPGTVYKGSNLQTAATVQACLTWSDGTHETTTSPIVSRAVNQRSSVNLSLPKRTGLQKCLYYRLSTASAWTRVSLSENTTNLTVDDFAAPITTYPLPATNTFPNATPGIFKSANGNIEFRGDGSGQAGPLTFHADGTMTSTAIPDWVPITSFLNGAKPAGFGNVPAYRIWPDGKVEWRGIVEVSTNGTTATTNVITVPGEARPENAAYLGGPGNSGVWVRIDVCDPAASAALRVVPNVAMKWVSLDPVYYYLT